ncbi:MAG: sel1 repeat family protein [Lachnospiraceae bacterium]|nr:sel1 repeat family protein [Lachnospiraceae bacterium]
MKNRVNFVICFAQMLERIKKQTENTAYAETCEAATEALEDDVENATVFDVAYRLHLCDADKSMPDSVTEFLKTVYQIGIDEGLVLSMNNMGSLYYTDRAGMKDYRKAMKYYTMAADTGFPLAAANLGFIYYYGLGTEVDYEKAYRYFSTAAMQGNLEALYMTGDMFRYGYYVKKSYPAAFVLYKQAADRCTSGEETDCSGFIFMRMGDCCYEGIGTEKDMEGALMFYQMAERYFYDQIKDGDPFAGEELERAIKVQTKIRRQIAKELPPLEWKKAG